MLIRSTWTLTVSEPALLPRAYHLELVKELHRRLELEVGTETVPSVTFSGIQGFCQVSQDFQTFTPDEFYTLSLSGLQENAAKAIASLNLSPSLEFLGAKFDIINREDEITSYEQLYTELVANEPEPIRRFDLKFTTPTAFAQGSTHLALPVVNLMFRSWLERWNHFAPVYLGSDELIAYLNQAVLLKHHKIQTRSHQLPRGYVNGFVGQVTLQIPYRTDSLLANVANLLIQYSQYSGTGIKTRLGMGQTNINLDNTGNHQ
ncbi:CRISPR system precrRNA processing endoribonuclease RAMP protein Cas6 [Tychonema sp. LEGE 07203]|uniref:CRISPR system precrRNA processing endoribonuclease RAMP protein Cas6 n=1 Tax=Tychonema sp. LEGE 07203 TaxID=1828671 RepID=UPI00187FCCD9|nr:CRISPR system precrRNA processing endoribonuclease RAMP protein Cas6 [Tychonema sp. LEGE 07203]MBE9095868.1 CRISPR system precrRNA processing endoribonuclease RAMP protein Cas6 [Tychonema sp. LEGE 07203]